jgi:hypothetical protein
MNPTPQQKAEIDHAVAMAREQVERAGRPRRLSKKDARLAAEILRNAREDLAEGGVK